jgi:hypothetical protein
MKRKRETGTELEMYVCFNLNNTTGGGGKNA